MINRADGEACAGDHVTLDGKIGFLVNYENYSLLHKHFNRKLSFMLSKIGLI